VANALDLRAIRRELHQCPEPSQREYQTTARVRAWLADLGVEPLQLALESGLVADIVGDRSGPVVALRADLDALPVQEGDTPAARAGFASRTAGWMHACGHDFHTTALVGAAQLLCARREQLPGRVRLIFQPAEEDATGALAIIRAGALADPEVSMIFALHSFPGLGAGEVGVTSGPLMAASDSLDLTVRGLGGHAGLPHRARDPIVATSALIAALQTAVSRATDPFATAVISLGTIEGGTDRNVIPSTVVARGTVRTFAPGVRTRTHDEIRRLAQGIAHAHSVEVSVHIAHEGDPVVNAPVAAALVRAAATYTLGAQAVRDAQQVMAGEDFAHYLAHVPGCMFWLGTAAGQTAGEAPAWHHPDYDTDESALPGAAAVLAETAIRALESLNGGATHHA
jgi:N-acetylcysteine deacetylase